MVLISLLLHNEEELQFVYDVKGKKFDMNKFKQIVTQLKRNLFLEGDLKKLGDLLFYGILNPNSK